MKKFALVFFSAAIVLSAATTLVVHASDHDDGEIDLKGRNLNLTDLYVFREGDENGVAADKNNLIFLMNTNPRSLPGFQYYFSTQARYQFHITRVTGTNDQAPAPADDVILRFTFQAPDANNRQGFTVTAIKDGSTFTTSTDSTGAAFTTTSIADSHANTVKTFDFTMDGSTLTVFAGLREDSFFFDVNGYFKKRNALLGGPAFAGFPDPGAGLRADFTTSYNVNSIALRVPKTFLGGTTGIFDVWETISVPK